MWDDPSVIVPVRWFPAPDGAKGFEGFSYLRSSYWFDPNDHSPPVGELPRRTYGPNMNVDVWGFLGQDHCGPREALLTGGVEGRDEPLDLAEDGGALCCPRAWLAKGGAEAGGTGYPELVSNCCLESGGVPGTLYLTGRDGTIVPPGPYPELDGVRVTLQKNASGSQWSGLGTLGRTIVEYLLSCRGGRLFEFLIHTPPAGFTEIGGITSLRCGNFCMTGYNRVAHWVGPEATLKVWIGADPAVCGPAPLPAPPVIAQGGAEAGGAAGLMQGAESYQGEGGAEAGGAADLLSFLYLIASGGAEAGASAELSGSGALAGSGGAEAGGAADLSASASAEAAGGAEAGGAAEVLAPGLMAGSGGAEAGGAAELAGSSAIVAAGGAEAGGAAELLSAAGLIGQGGAEAGGAAGLGSGFGQVAAGGAESFGLADLAEGFTLAAAGGAAAGGAADIASGVVMIPGGRLSLAAGSPVSPDVGGANVLFYSPYTSSKIELWNGSAWIATTFNEFELVLSGMTPARPHDVFARLLAGVAQLELAPWNSDTTRAEPVSIEDGRYVKTSDKTRLLLGTIYALTATTTCDDAARRYVANLYNAVPRRLHACPGYSDDNSPFSFTLTNTSYLELNGGNGSRVSWVCCLPGGPARVSAAFTLSAPAGTTALGGIGVDSASSATVLVAQATNQTVVGSAGQVGLDLAGKHFACLVGRVSSGTGTVSSEGGRGGSAADPKATYLEGAVYG